MTRYGQNEVGKRLQEAEEGTHKYTAEIFEKIAEVALEMPQPAYRWSAAHWAEVYMPLLKRIQDLKKELEV
jgi:1,2-phenylacetyl-CoA epoxidase catalytic subunit